MQSSTYRKGLRPTPGNCVLLSDFVSVGNKLPTLPCYPTQAHSTSARRQNDWHKKPHATSPYKHSGAWLKISFEGGRIGNVIGGASRVDGSKYPGLRHSVDALWRFYFCPRYRVEHLGLRG